MAEGWCNFFYSSKYSCFSAGVERHGINPYAIKVMSEVGIDIKNNQSNLVSEYFENDMDLVITVCDHAKQTCPIFSYKCLKLHKSFDDPPSLVKDIQKEEEILAVYRRVRDEIKDFVLSIDSDGVWNG